MTLRFGTDGVRGVANRELTPELVTALGRAAVARARSRRAASSSGATPGGRVRCSRPRSSAGLCAEGADVVLVGVLPTPGVAQVAPSSAAPRPR